MALKDIKPKRIRLSRTKGKEKAPAAEDDDIDQSAQSDTSTRLIGKDTLEITIDTDNGTDKDEEPFQHNDMDGFVDTDEDRTNCTRPVSLVGRQ